MLTGLLLVAAAYPALSQEDVEEPAWTASASLRVLSRLSTHGVDVGSTGVTTLLGGDIAHASGFELNAAVALLPGATPAYQRSTLGASYTAPIDEEWDWAIGLDHSFYPDGSTDPFSASPTSFTAALDYSGDIFSTGFEYEKYLGASGASYVSVSASAYFDLDAFSLLPIMDLSFGSQTVSSKLLKRHPVMRQGGPPSTTTTSALTTVTGLSSIDVSLIAIVPLAEGWSLSLAPGVSYTPSDLATTTTRFTWSAGIRRSFAF